MKKIALSCLKYYFLTCDVQGERAQHMISEFKNFNITPVTPVLGISKFKSASIGFSRMIDLGLSQQDVSKPFQPFVIFEDDVSMYRPFPNEIEIPVDTDILYIGISKFRTDSEFNIDPSVCCEIFDKNLARIYNMLSTHGIIICSSLGAR